MINKFVFIIFLGAFFCTEKVWSTTFQPMPLDKLVEESSSAAEVELKTKKSFMNKMGLILTEYTFLVGESFNLEDADQEGEVLKITMTGGTVNGVTSFIDGAPEFEVGEKSFLLLKKIESKMYLSNFTMGKYKIENENGQIYYQSTVFPLDKEIGRVKKEKMIEMLKLKYKISRAPELDPRSDKKEEEKLSRNSMFEKEPSSGKRTPAQTEPLQESSDGLMAMWAFLALLIVGGITVWMKLSKGSCE